VAQRERHVAQKEWPRGRLQCASDATTGPSIPTIGSAGRHISSIPIGNCSPQLTSGRCIASSALQSSVISCITSLCFSFHLSFYLCLGDLNSVTMLCGGKQQVDLANTNSLEYDELAKFAVDEHNNHQVRVSVGVTHLSL
jgi:hypothetical protein